MKYFIKSNASRPVPVDGTNHFFEVAEQVAGTSWGVYATDDQKVIEAFLAKGISEINQFEYERLYQKKSSQNLFSVSMNQRRTPEPLPANNPKQLPSQQAKEVEKSSDPVAEDKPSADELLSQLESVKPVDADDSDVEAEPEPKIEWVSKIDDIVKMFDVEPHLVREYLRDGPDSIKRDNKKGYNVAEWEKLLSE